MRQSPGAWYFFTHFQRERGPHSAPEVDVPAPGVA